MAREDKTRSLNQAHAETRLIDARTFLEQADISLQLVDGPRRHAVVASSAVLAGIAASDAACALVLGLTSAAHGQSAKLLARVSGSTKAVADLSRLISIKTAVQYAGESMTERQATDAIARARRLSQFAESLRRR